MRRPRADDDPRVFIQARLPVAPIPSIPEIALHMATASSGLWRLAQLDADGASPYWAYPWAGGLALARHVLNEPGCVAGKRVLDLGAGSGLVGIAAAKAGASAVTGADIDPNAIAALALNAAVNAVAVAAVLGDPTAEDPPDVDVILVGDLFYDGALAGRVTTFLDRCVAAGIAVLVGDPGRAFLPRERLRLIASYVVRDVGEAADRQGSASAVFVYEPGQDANRPTGPCAPIGLSRRPPPG